MPTLCCPICKSSLDVTKSAYRCRQCFHSYPVLLGIPDFRVLPDPYIGIEDDRKKSKFLAANASELDFDDLVRFYWSITPEVRPELVERFSRKALLLQEKWELALPEYERHLEAEPESILEVGCGSGGFLAAAGKRYGRKVVGVDIALRWLVVARKRLHEAGLDLPLICACAEYLPFREHQFDLVVGEAVIEHTRDRKKFLEECSRVARPSGDLFLITPNRFSPTPEPHVGVWGVGFLPRKWMNAYVQLVKGIPYRHLHLVSTGEVRRLLQEAGLGLRSFILPDITPVEVEHLSLPKRLLVHAYRFLKERTLTSWLIRRVGPVITVICRFPERDDSSLEGREMDGDIDPLRRTGLSS